MISTTQTIRTEILNMQRPFRLSDLFIRLGRKGIDDQELIMQVLDDLRDAGLVKYSEIEDDCWAYTSALVSA
jgi:hypothetical protein